MKNNLITLIFIFIFFASCGDNKKEIVVYTTVDQVFSEPVLRDFEKATGIKVKAVFDTEETKSTGVVNRIIAEKNNPQCNVFWSGDPLRAVFLKQKGLTMPFDCKEAAGIDDVFKDKDKHWYGFSARARVLIYNKNMIKEEDVPESLLQLTEPQYKGKVAIANPLFGTTTFHIAALFVVLGDEKAKRYLEELKKNGVVIAASNGDVKKRVASGRIPLGLTDTDDAHEALKEGAPVGVVFTDQNGMGNLIIPNTVSIIKGTKNMDAAKQLVKYLLSKETERKLAESCAQMPLHKGVPVPPGVPSLDKIKPMDIDYETAAAKLEEIQNYLKRWVESR